MSMLPESSAMTSNNALNRALDKRVPDMACSHAG